MAILINGKIIAQKITRQTAKKTAALKKEGALPKLAVILVGQNKLSAAFVRRKADLAKKIGINFKAYRYPAKTGTAGLIKKINTLQKDKRLSGLVVQLPLPNNFNTKKILNSLDPQKDVDFLTETNLKKSALGQAKLWPPTAGAILTILKELKINLKNKKITLVGTGFLVGQPLFNLLKQSGAKITACNRQTKDLKKECLGADIIISATGQKNIITGNMIKKGAIVIDAGSSAEDGKIYGDVNFKEVSKKAKYITPTPGGVGPITVARLLWNTVNQNLLE